MTLEANPIPVAGEPAEAVSIFIFIDVILKVEAAMLVPEDNVIPVAASEQVIPD